MQRPTQLTPDSPLEDLARTLGQAWLRLGADAIEIQRGGVSVASWPEGAIIPTPDLAAPLIAHGETLGELRLSGLLNGSSRSHLETQAELLARVLRLGQELESVSQALITSQNQVAALGVFAACPRSRENWWDLLPWLAAQTARLLETGGAFVWLAAVNEPAWFVQHPTSRLTAAQVSDLAPLVNHKGFFWNGAEVLPALARHIVDLVCVPVEGGHVQGLLGAWDKEGGQFTPTDLEFASIISALASERLGQ